VGRRDRTKDRAGGRSVVGRVPEVGRVTLADRIGVDRSAVAKWITGLPGRAAG